MSTSPKSPPTEKPPPPPKTEASPEESDKNQRNLQHQHHHHNRRQDEEIDKQEQEIIASLELEEREHKKYMDTVNAMRSKIINQLIAISKKLGQKIRKKIENGRPFGLGQYISQNCNFSQFAKL